MIYLLCKTALHGRPSMAASPFFRRFCILRSYPSKLSLRFVSTTSNQNSFTLSYLINACGFSPESASLASATLASKGILFETPDKPDSVIAFFKNLGISKTQIASIIKKRPELLVFDTEKTLLPKVEFLRSRGFSSSDLATILSLNPHLLARSLENHIIPSFNIFSNNLSLPDESAFKAIKRFPRILTMQLEDELLPNINTLREIGVRESHIVNIFRLHPRTFWMDQGAFKEIIDQVQKMGFHPSTLNFVSAIRVLRSLSRSKWEWKVEIYKKLGWTEEDVLKAFKLDPTCMFSSAEKIIAVMDFLVNKMGIQPSVVAKAPVVLKLSLEKRIIPRGLFAQHLMSKGLVKNFSLQTLFYTTEESFLQKFVNCHEEKKASELLKLYEQKLGLPR
ncbi:hypothetical protein SLEP1_g40219 [Rubroshorea leprosula]|uniref:Uncharacterized protein n=1 Tax=Rubroshorea leprosula TaxID=152421 RepID=A0AAV5L2R5_9ROSI|nr:hypothetical protein SLEP1_g40219 [Rubroshorea leprosula]